MIGQVTIEIEHAQWGHGLFGQTAFGANGIHEPFWGECGGRVQAMSEQR